MAHRRSGGRCMMPARLRADEGETWRRPVSGVAGSRQQPSYAIQMQQQPDTPAGSRWRDGRGPGSAVSLVEKGLRRGDRQLNAVCKRRVAFRDLVHKMNLVVPRSGHGQRRRRTSAAAAFFPGMNFERASTPWLPTDQIGCSSGRGRRRARNVATSTSAVSWVVFSSAPPRLRRSPCCSSFLDSDSDFRRSRRGRIPVPAPKPSGSRPSSGSPSPNSPLPRLVATWRVPAHALGWPAHR